MSEFTASFINHLQGLADRDRGAMAALRRSLGFEPGAYPPAYPVVERFAAQGPESESQRQALYLCAGLFALHPLHASGRPLAGALGQAMQQRGSDSIEKRFIALLASEPESLPNHLRQVISLLAADQLPIDYAELLADLGRLLQRWNEEQRDRVRQRWARAFYRAIEPAQADAGTAAATDGTQGLAH